MRSGVDITENRNSRERIVAAFGKLQNMTGGIIRSISRLVELRDPYTAGHQKRVGQLAYAIARELGLSEEQCRGIRVAGLVHDIGKMNVPAEILSKPGRLTQIEFEIIKIHPQAGYDILKSIEFPWPVAQVALQHQERLDGSGYPKKLTSEDILHETKIVSIADTVEAMTFHRPYRLVVGVEEALNQIETHKGTLYDAAAVEQCARLFREKGFQFER